MSDRGKIVPTRRELLHEVSELRAEAIKLHQEIAGLRTAHAMSEARNQMAEPKLVALKLAFARRVDQLWVDPGKSIHYSAHKDGTAYAYTPVEKEPAGLYPAIIVPKDLIGKAVKVVIPP